MTATTRTQDEILARVSEQEGSDWLGFGRQILLTALDFEHVKPFLMEGVTIDEWPALDVEAAARDYLEFALGKILGHRGISADRSVSKLTEYAWLMGRDDVVEAMERADYANYGAPKVRVFAEGLGWTFNPGGEPELGRMAAGLPCTPDCLDGCSS